MSDERRGALVALSLSFLTVFASLGLGRFGFGMVWPAMQEALHLTDTEGGLLQSWNSVGYLAFVVIAGVLATRYGFRLVIVSALVLIGAGMLLTGASTEFKTLCLGRFLVGVGGAAANVPAMAMLADWFSPRRRGLAAGCAVAGSSLGLAATGAGVPWLLRLGGADGWRACWHVFGATTLAVCLLSALFLRNKHPRAAAYDVPAAPDNKERGGLGHLGTVLRSSLLWQIAVGYIAFGFAYSIYATFFVKHLVGGMGFTEERAGAVWMTIGLFSIVSGFLWGAVSDRWGRRPALIAIFVCQGMAFISAGMGWGMAGIVVSGALFACTAWSIPAVVVALCGDGFGPRLASTALGVATVIFGLGQVAGPYVGGAVADAAESNAPAFLLAGVVAWVLGAGGSLLLPGRSGKSAQKRDNDD
ncbi:MFS transporter [Candidatus Sumerlaeota bacterium]|nr:MFS transporter [Candidatus Sumerlaeota bacterium]